jgi:transcriptional regulator with XRE-family HTH domain
MSDQNPISLDAQIIARVRQFLRSTNFSQRRLAAAVGSDPGNFSAFLAGAKSLSVNKMAKLLEILGLDRMQLQAKFSPSVTARIEHFQSLNGKLMKLDGGSGDANDGDGSGDDPDTDYFLRKQLAIHQKAIDLIQGYLDGKVTKAKINSGPSGCPRRVNGNAPAGGGTRGDLLSVKPAQMLAHLEKVRANAETELAIQQKINEERKKRLAAQIELAEVRKESLFDTKG